MDTNIEAGLRISDFKIIKGLGTGGMGIVYLAKQVSLNRLVALKVIGPTIGDPRARARFRREAQAVALLKHSGIATVHYAGQDDKLCYMATEYIDGSTLRQVFSRLAAARDTTITLDYVLQQTQDDVEKQEIRFDVASSESDDLLILSESESGDENSLSAEAERIIRSNEYIRRCCEIVRDAAFALDHAHNNGVVHRDFKPLNLMLDQKGGVHIIDFGVARFRDDISLSHTGALVGTPMYMSPEHITGRVNIDHRSDIFSLGIVLYEALTLRPPYSAQTREGIFRQIATKAMPPVSARNRAVSRKLEAVVHKAIARDPGERYSSAEALAQDLQRVIAGKSITARPYHYRFDNREIEAERPHSILIAAVILAIMGFALTWDAIFSLFGIRPYIQAATFLFIVGLWMMWTARALTLAKRMSVFSTVTLSIILGLPSFMHRYVISPEEYTRDKLQYYSFYVFSVASIILVVVCFLPRTRRWFRLARTLRTEYARQTRRR